MLKMIGPHVEEEVWKQSSEKISDCVPQAYKSAWLPPVFDARHVSVDKDMWYEVEVQLGPITVVSCTNSLSNSLQSLCSHVCCFLKNRNLEQLIREPIEESLKEMEVFSHLNQPYVQSKNLIEVRMDGPDGAQIVPPVDVFHMQQYLPDGFFPYPYGARDVLACIKVELVTGSDLTYNVRHNGCCLLSSLHKG